MPLNWPAFRSLPGNGGAGRAGFFQSSLHGFVALSFALLLESREQAPRGIAGMREPPAGDGGPHDDLKAFSGSRVLLVEPTGRVGCV